MFNTLEPLWKSALHHNRISPTVAIESYKYNLREHIPEEERGDMIAAYYKRLTSSDQVFNQLIFTKDHYNDLVSLQLSLQKIIL